MTMLNPSALAKHLRTLRERKALTPHEYAVGDALLWRTRQPGRVESQISFTRLARLAGVGRTTAVAAVAKLRTLGLLVREKTRLRVVWGGGVASRQGRNIYRWIAAATECARQPTTQGQVSKQDGLTGGWWQRLRPLPPVRSVAEQLAMLGR